MPKPLRIMSILSFVLLFSCSVALDFEAISRGEENNDSDNDTGSEPKDTDTGTCSSDSQCDDEIDCTTDVCKSDGSCSNLPDNGKCEYLEMCSREEGCVDTGKECLVNSDCDDGVDCTDDDCAGGVCRNQPNDKLCEDPDNQCIINRTCVAGSGCAEGEPKGCSQSNLGPCQERVCNPANGECEEATVDGADDDDDEYLDSECGGDDCDDGNDTIHPGVDDVCNLKDDDCDGLTDMKAVAGPVEIQRATGLFAPGVAYDGQRYAVVWQRGEANDAVVYTRVLGTGDCLTDSTCDGVDDSSPASEPLNLTPRGGQDSDGLSPAITGGSGEFFVAWVKKVDGANPAVLLIGVDYDAASGAATPWSDAEQLSSDGVHNVMDPQIEWVSDARGWIAAWGRAFADDSTAVELMDKGMLDRADLPFAGIARAGELGGLDLAALDDDNCVVTYAAEDSFDTANWEVYEEHLTLTGQTWGDVAGWPMVVSARAELYEDPSYHPTVTAAGNDNWVTAFADVRVPSGGNSPEPETDIRALKSDDTAQILTLQEDTTFDQLHPELVFDGTGYGLLYVQETTAGQTLDFRLLDSGLSRLPSQGGRLARLQPGEVRSGPLIVTDNGFATAWIESPGTGDDALLFAAFEGCVQAAE